jgi:excinuclease UvrABC nuclease subunit
MSHTTAPSAWVGALSRRRMIFAVFGAEIARQHKSDWKQALLEVQKEHAERRRQVQQQHIDDCVATMKNASKKATEAHKEQEEQLDEARQHLARIKTWQQVSDQGAIWREDMYQTMGTQQSLS